MTRRKNTVTRSVTLTQCRRVVHCYLAHYTLSVDVYSIQYTVHNNSCTQLSLECSQQTSDNEKYALNNLTID